MYLVSVTPSVNPLVGFVWVITSGGSVIEFGSQLTFNLALKQAGAKLKQYADALL